MVKRTSKTIIEYQPEVKESRAYAFFKRLLDIVASLCAMICALPVMLVIVVMIECTFSGHAVYVDKRVGKNGKTIGVIKFRTMRKDANENAELYLSTDQLIEYEKERKVKDDPRVTRLGGFLRKSTLDELPQLWNIFIGQLSFVGPRPITQEEYEKNYDERQREALLRVKPGWTGNWCAHGRYSATYENGRRQKLELEYLAQRSLKRDCAIFFVTLRNVLTYKDTKK